jgi:P-type Ca2+ transporter type 2C
MVLPVRDEQFNGLSGQEASDRLKRDGYNELPSSEQRNFLAIALEIVREPIFLLLIACGVIYLFLGDAREALILLGFIFLIVGMIFPRLWNLSNWDGGSLTT